MQIKEKEKEDKPERKIIVHLGSKILFYVTYFSVLALNVVVL
jgi:hypothetical protein